MKKTILISMILFATLFANAQTHDTISGKDGRIPGYYYSFWYDTCDWYLNPNTAHIKPTTGTSNQMHEGWYGTGIPQPFPHPSTCHTGIYSMFAKMDYVGMPTALKGVAVFAINPREWLEWIDGAMSPYHTPEYILILKYDSANNEMTELARVRWDTANYKIYKYPFVSDTETYGFRHCRVYEAMFEQPVIVDSAFYLAGTQNNMTAVDPHCAVTQYSPLVYVGTIEPTSRERNSCRVPRPNRSVTPKLNKIDGAWDFVYLLYQPMVDSATVTVEVNDSAMGKAGSSIRRSKWVPHEIYAIPEYGHRFSHWNDGNTENPRDIYLTQDTHFIAYFEPNTRHTVRTACFPKGMGIVTGEGTYWRGDTATLKASSVAPYRFHHWNDGSEENPRQVAIEGDTSFYAYFRVSEQPDTTAGINPVEDAASLFTLTPNPTTGTVRVDWGGHTPVGHTPVGHTPSPLRGTPPILGGELIVHDAAGHEVMRMKVETGQKAVELDLAALPKGTYFVTLTTPQATGTQRLVLQ